MRQDIDPMADNRGTTVDYGASALSGRALGTSAAPRPGMARGGEGASPMRGILLAVAISVPIWFVIGFGLYRFL